MGLVQLCLVWAGLTPRQSVAETLENLRAVNVLAGLGCGSNDEQLHFAVSATFYPFSLWNSELKRVWEDKVTFFSKTIRKQLGSVSLRSFPILGEISLTENESSTPKY